MPFCPTCRSEYESHIKSCADCGANLVDKLPPGAIPEIPSDLTVLVWTDKLASDVICNELEESGLFCHVEPSLNTTGIFPSGFRVLVSKRDLKKAAIVLESVRQQYPSIKLDYTGMSENPPPVF